MNGQTFFKNPHKEGKSHHTTKCDLELECDLELGCGANVT